jgi:anti-sigma-K factor RskA
MIDTDAHERGRDLAEEYVFGTLSLEDERWVDEHLATCADCRRYVDDLRAVADALARSTPPLAAPPELRASLLAATSGQPTRVLTRRRWGAWALGAAAAAVISGLGVATGLSRYELASTQRRLADARTVAAAIADGQRVIRLAPVSGSGPGVVWVKPRSGPPLLYGPNLPPLPPDKTYELWFLAGGNATPAGTFLANQVVAGPPLPAGTTALAVTIEPRGGSPKPTGNPIVLGKV